MRLSSRKAQEASPKTPLENIGMIRSTSHIEISAKGSPDILSKSPISFFTVSGKSRGESYLNKIIEFGARGQFPQVLGGYAPKGLYAPCGETCRKALHFGAISRGAQYLLHRDEKKPPGLRRTACESRKGTALAGLFL
jgi:hypothetical protein